MDSIPVIASTVADLADPLRSWLGQKVVLDTYGPIVYLGTLAEVTPQGFRLTDADFHDCRDGHATKERYVLEAAEGALRRNRGNVFVLRHVVISVSALSDCLCD